MLKLFIILFLLLTTISFAPEEERTLTIGDNTIDVTLSLFLEDNRNTILVTDFHEVEADVTIEGFDDINDRYIVYIDFTGSNGLYFDINSHTPDRDFCVFSLTESSPTKTCSVQFSRATPNTNGIVTVDINQIRNHDQEIIINNPSFPSVSLNQFIWAWPLNENECNQISCRDGSGELTGPDPNWDTDGCQCNNRCDFNGDCASGFYCDGGSCDTTRNRCSDTCGDHRYGETWCNGNQILRCGDYDRDNCDESRVIQTCVGGSCIDSGRFEDSAACILPNNYVKCGATSCNSDTNCCDASTSTCVAPGERYDNDQKLCVLVPEDDTTITQELRRFFDRIKEIFTGRSQNNCRGFANPLTGDGSEEKPCLITTPQHLDNVRHNLNNSFILGNDIDLSRYDNWSIIDTDADGYGFQGTFDGNGYKIRNLFISLTGFDPSAGLFSMVKDGTIKNLGLENVIFEHSSSIHSAGGAIAFRIINSEIINSYVTGLEISFPTHRARRSLGGLVGVSENSNISESFVRSARITGGNNIGGLVGRSSNSRITNSYTRGLLLAGIDDVGGIIGEASGTNTISNVYSTASVSSCSQCTFRTVSSGGIIGGSDGSLSCSNNYYYNSNSGSNYISCGSILSSFSNLTSPTSNTGIYRNWDLTIWDFGTSSDFPRLRWETE